MVCIIAHRGASAVAPENTLPAFALAQSQAADMLELDVQRTADAVLVVFHDTTTERWDGQPRPLHRCTLADLRALDINGATVPTLAEVCAFARQHQIALNIELKQRGIAAQAIQLLRAYSLEGRALISSFSVAALREACLHAPAIQRGYLVASRSPHPLMRARALWPFFDLRRTAASAWHPAHDLPLLRRLLPLLRRAGYAVNVWTVDDPGRIRQLAAWGATGIITNRPDLARAALDA